MKDRPKPPIALYVPPHQRLRSIIVVLSSPPPSFDDDAHHQSSRFSNGNPSFDFAVVAPLPFSNSSNQEQKQEAKQEERSWLKERNGLDSEGKVEKQEEQSWLKERNGLDSERKVERLADKRKESGAPWRSNSQLSGVRESVSVAFEPSWCPSGVMLSQLLKDKDMVELVSREKKDRRDFEQIASLAGKMGSYSHSYVKVVVFSKVPLPNYRFDLDEKRPLGKETTDTSKRELIREEQKPLTLSQSGGLS